MSVRKTLRSASRGPLSFVTLILGILAFLGVVSWLTEYNTALEKVSYDRFIELVEKREVKHVDVIGSDVSGLTTSGTRFVTVVPATSDVFWSILKDNKVGVDIHHQQTHSDYWFIGILFFLLVAALVSWMIARMLRSQNSSSANGPFFSFGKSRVRRISPQTIKESFDDVIGADDAKKALSSIVDFLKEPERYRAMNARMTRGVLLIGEPGTGKTMLARALAGEAKCPFFSVSGSEFMEMFVGVGASRVRDLFAQARKAAPAIVFIDELDAIGRRRSSTNMQAHEEREQTLNQLLTEMDGFEQGQGPVVVIAATNVPETLDRALLRPGRFDVRVVVSMPNTTARAQLFERYFADVPHDESVSYQQLAERTAGMSAADIENMVNQAALIAVKHGREKVSAADVTEAHRLLLSSHRTDERSSVFLPEEVSITFDKVAGMDEAKAELVEVVDFLKSPDKYARLGARVPRGILLVGDPGNGKTLLAKAVAGESGRPFIAATGSEFIEQYVGVGASRVRDLFDKARKNAPCVLFIDEIDAVAMRRGQTAEGGNSEYVQTLNQILAEMDGFASHTGEAVIVLAATNREDSLDPAIMRPGRFDRKVYVPYPDSKGRLSILHVHTKKQFLADDVDLSVIARGTPGMSGADIANLANEAAICAIRNGHDRITMDDFEEARERMIIGLQRKSTVLSPDELRMTAYHEAGHAIALLMQPDLTEPLYKVTIVPRGHALGVTSWLPERDKYSEYQDELEAQLVVALGGRAAEELVFKRASTGAVGDFQGVRRIAYSMVKDYGMSERVGTVCLRGAGYSEETARIIDEEVRRIVSEAYKKTLDLLTKEREKLDMLAQALLDRETLQAAEVYELLGVTPRQTHDFSQKKSENEAVA